LSKGGAKRGRRIDRETDIPIITIEQERHTSQTARIAGQEAIEDVEVALALVLTDDTVLMSHEINDERMSVGNLLEQIVDDLAALNVATLVERNLEELSETEHVRKQNGDGCGLPARVVVVHRLGIAEGLEDRAANMSEETQQPTPQTHPQYTRLYIHIMNTCWR
jgi:hypothetical protein